MKKFFSVLLSILFALALLFTLLLSVVRFNFSYSTITELAGQLLRPVSAAPVIEYQDDGLFHPGDIKITYAGYEEYGDFDNIVAHAGDIKGKVGEMIAQNQEIGRISRDLAIIKTEIELFTYTSNNL